ncbi:MAG: acyl-ACP--UDP-N-acetylglucosamine O-acyltransferase [Holosporaceae bacterium]|jgi:UDP-N-acetylglucosamine acyltransferase|nr:acyl-ACP--UDP-N-acetylglucosamine O-acyltransferase [Holosporaceae bacterium]
MWQMIHPTAIVSSSARIGKNVKVGPYSIIGENVELGDNVEIMAHVCVTGYTIIGEQTRIFPFAAIGYAPQDLKYKGEKSRLLVGKRNIIREYATMHPGTKSGAMETIVGDDNLLMIGIHIAHDCVVGHNVVMGNNATLGGHVKIGDDVIIGGLAAIHQRVRIGQGAIIGGMSGVERDVIPYGAVKGERAHLYDINIIGLRRNGVNRQDILALKKAYNMIFSEKDTVARSVENVEKTIKGISYVDCLIKFMKENTERSLCLPKENK